MNHIGYLNFNGNINVNNITTNIYGDKNNSNMTRDVSKNHLDSQFNDEDQ